MQPLEALARFRRSGEARAAAVPFSDAQFRRGKYKDGALLRLRGVVRDVRGPELVVLAREAEDGTAATGEKMAEKMVERVPLAVAALRLEAWAEGGGGDAAASAAGGGEGARGAAVARGTAKRKSEAVSEQQQEEQENAGESKKPRAEGAEETEEEAAAVAAHGVSVYVYDGQCPGVALDAFRVNEAFEFVGVLDLAVAGAEDRAAADALSVQQLRELQISDCLGDVQQKTQLGAVLHCCDVMALDNIHHVRPNEPAEFFEQLTSSNAARMGLCSSEWKAKGQTGEIAAVRSQLINYLSNPLGGDQVAAEYLLLCLLSRVYARPDSSTPLGNLSLNLALGEAVRGDAIKKFVEELHSTLRMVVPMVADVNLSLQNLNTTRFAPHKNYEQDVLVGGTLQVANGTVVVVDETQLTAGQLNDRGVRNMDVLQALVGKMLLPYDFQYYSMDFPQDVAIVTVSEAKSILPVTVSIPLKPEATFEPIAPATASMVDCFRLFLAVLRSMTVSLGNEEADMAEKHYVDRRKAKENVQVSCFYL